MEETTNKGTGKQNSSKVLYWLQIWHISMLLMIPIFYVIFCSYSESQDQWRFRMDLVIRVLATAYGVSLVIFSIVYGIGTPSPDIFIKIYRKLAQNKLFLILSNVTLVIVTLLLFFQILMYRQVEFTCNVDSNLYIENTYLGDLEAKKPKKYRLLVGSRDITSEAKQNKSIATSNSITVPFWADMPLQVSIDMLIPSQDLQAR